jgi:hypothetical protein
MRLARLTISNFQSFGERSTTIELEDLTYVLGPNGAGKTAVLQAIVRMFGIDPNLRRVRRSDFHVALDTADLSEIDKLVLWIEAEFELPEAGDESTIHSTIPPSFNHMQLESNDETPRVRFRLSAILDLDGEIEEKIRYVAQADPGGNPVKLVDMSKHDRHAIHVHYLPPVATRRTMFRMPRHLSLVELCVLRIGRRNVTWSGASLKELTPRSKVTKLSKRSAFIWARIGEVCTRVFISASPRLLSTRVRSMVC